ncbi:hypothetical protein [Mucilaginibacter sp. PPCGB 2223]|uniref:hypothetical protein n=1 Tax=Mucilaginibacter sp. PPCGB 2223 TaxID=1886027 RepID=UPI001585EAFF|nr:hypothetical protein [Mucilaginibacter sp. PPCGB 2223]
MSTRAKIRENERVDKHKSVGINVIYEPPLHSLYRASINIYSTFYSVVTYNNKKKASAFQQPSVPVSDASSKPGPINFAFPQKGGHHG